MERGQAKTSGRRRVKAWIGWRRLGHAGPTLSHKQIRVLGSRETSSQTRLLNIAKLSHSKHNSQFPIPETNTTHPALSTACHNPWLPATTTFPRCNERNSATSLCLSSNTSKSQLTPKPQWHSQLTEHTKQSEDTRHLIHRTLQTRARCSTRVIRCHRCSITAALRIWHLRLVVDMATLRLVEPHGGRDRIAMAFHEVAGPGSYLPLLLGVSSHTMAGVWTSDTNDFLFCSCNNERAPDVPCTDTISFLARSSGELSLGQRTCYLRRFCKIF